MNMPLPKPNSEPYIQQHVAFALESQSSSLGSKISC